MTESLICPRGHEWQHDDGDDSPRAGPPSACPICGPAGGGSARRVDDVIDPWLTIAPGNLSTNPTGSPESDLDLRGIGELAIDPGNPASVPSPPSTLDNPVTMIAGYEVLSVLGRGAMGVVYKARQRSLNRLVALKMILAGSHAGAEDRARFLAEAEAVAALHHPAIVQVHEVGEHQGLPFFSMEIVDGGSLDGKTRGKPLPARKAAALMDKVARAMHYAHQQGVVHRDLKPANILLTADGEPKITDFGLAKRLLKDPHATAGRYATQTGTAVGTPSYMAPEQAAGNGKLVGPRADVYSLGAVLYELLTGRPPFVAETAMDTLLLVVTEEPPSPSRLQPRLPKDLVTITLKCLCKEPEKRYGSAGELADDLGRFLDGEPIRAMPAGPWVRFVKWARRRPTAAALIAVSTAAALALCGGGIAYQVRLNRALAEAKAQRLAAVERLVRLNVQNGMGLADRGHLPASLPHLVEALRLSTEMNRAHKPHAASADSGRMHRMRLAMVLRSCPRLVRAWFHQGQVFDAAFSPDGRLVVSAGADHLVCVWEVDSGDLIGSPLRHEGSVHQVSFSPDGERILTACADGTARIWEVADSREVCRSPRHDGKVMAAAFSPCGRRFCTASADGTARVYDAGDGREILPRLRHASAVSLAAFSPDGRRIVTVSGSSARLWDAATGTPAGPELRHGGTVLTAAFDHEGVRLVTGGEDHLARLWTVADGREQKPSLRHERAVLSACFSPDGTRVATASHDGAAMVWNAANGEGMTRRMGHHDRVNHLSFSPDGRFLATASNDNTSVVWDAGSGAPASHAMVSKGNILRVRFSPDGRHVLTASESGAVRMWDPVKAFRMPKPNSSFVPGPPSAKSGDGRLEVIPVDRLTLRIRDVQTGASVGPVLRSGGTVYSAAFDPAGRRLLTTSSDGMAQIWDVATGRPLTPPLVHYSPVLCGAFSPDGRLVATGSSDNTSRVWVAATGEPETPFMKHEGSVYRLAFTPDGHCLLTFSEDGSARIWDADTGEWLTPSLDPEGWVKQAIESPADPAAWDLSLDERPIEELRAVAEWFSGCRISEKTGELIPSTSGQLNDLSGLIRTRYPRLVKFSH